MESGLSIDSRTGKFMQWSLVSSGPILPHSPKEF